MKASSNFRLFVFTVCIALSLSVLEGCRKNSDAQPVALLLVKTLNNPYFVEMRSGVEDEWARQFPEVKLEVRAGTDEGDIKSHREVLDTFTRSYVTEKGKPQLKAVLITPASSGPELLPYIKAVRDAGIPVVVVDTKLDSNQLLEFKTDYTAFVGSSNRQGGEMAATFLHDRLPAAKTVLLLNGHDGHETAHERREGFLHKMQSLSPNVAIIERTCDWNRAKARATVGALIAGGQAIDGIFAGNDEMAIGALNAYDQLAASSKPAVIVGFDATEEARNLVKEGKLSATVAQDPRGMGKRAVTVLKESNEGKLKQRDNLIDVKLVQP